MRPGEKVQNGLRGSVGGEADAVGWDEHGPDHSRGTRFMSPEAKKRLEAMHARRFKPKAESTAA